VLSAAAFIMLFLSAHTALAAEKALNIIYTGAMRGELEPCGCSPETQSGGLARLSGYIMEQKAALSPYILVDSGNTFAVNTAQGRLKTEAQLRSFSMMGFDAAAVNINKASVDAAFVSRLVKEHRVAALPERGAIKAVKGGLKINISSNARLLKKGMINILLSGKPLAELKSVKGWDVIVSSSGEILEEPVASGKTTIVSGYPKGEKLGVLTLKLDRRGKVAGSVHKWVVLKKDAPEDPAVRAVLKEYDQKVAALLKEEELKPLSNGQYLGSQSCVECHQPFVESWKATRHAEAFATLEKAGKSKDPECVVCHTVGFGEEGGFLSLKSTPGLANVQCESCHGPSREHLIDFSPMKPIAKDVCLKCHTRENSPEFEYEKYLEKIKH
jgi:mono/diheme cytochrome c family protein